MTRIQASHSSLCAALSASVPALVLIAASLPAMAQTATGDRISEIDVRGNQRIEAETIQSYIKLAPGDRYAPQLIDDSLKTLFNTGLFADVTIQREGSALIVNVIENPIINRILFEGNKGLKQDKLTKEMKLAPRQVYTRSKVRADVQRLLEIYRRSGRFAAEIEPKIIELPQNRVDLVYEISEGSKSKVRRINFLGNKRFSDGDLRGAVATREGRWWRFLTSNDTYDPDRLAYDREVLRQYYLQRGYADFRVVSAVAELTPDRRDFLITMSLEEGEKYNFGKIDIESQIRDLDPKALMSGRLVKTVAGRVYNAKFIDNTIDALTDAAGEKGYAFVTVRPRIKRDPVNRKIDITYVIQEAPRVYVEKINITGNSRTLDKVVRREFRLVEGDAFNTSKLKRSKQRIKGLGFFNNDRLEIENVEGSTPDRTVINVNVQEQSTGELSIGAGFSSVENLVIDLSIRERNLLGTGQDLRLGVSASSLRRQIDLGFTNPYFMDKTIAVGADIYARRLDYQQESSFNQSSIGASLRAGFALTEYWSLTGRYSIRQDKLTDVGLTASRYVLAALGTYVTSSVGYSLGHDTTDDRSNPRRGHSFVLQQDVAGLGGNVKYLRNVVNFDQYFPVAERMVVNASFEGGYIRGLGQSVNINNRFFLGGDRMRGFAPAGIGPRDVSSTVNNSLGDALGGTTYYTGSLEFTTPLGKSEELGIKASAYVDVGALWHSDDVPIAGFSIAESASPRVSVGVGITWKSPMGPFRLDFAKAIKKQPYDDTEFFQFNVGTRF